MPVTVSSTPAAAVSATPKAPKDQHGGSRPDTRSDRKLAEGEHRDQQGHRVKDRDICADRVKHQPVARDLGAHRQQRERDHATATLVTHHRQARPQSGSTAHGNPA